MPNNAVFNFDPASLRSKIYGSQDAAISTDADGYLQIRSISDSVTVTATDLDIRDLTHAQDSLLIYGFDGTDNIRVRTDSDGYLQIRSISDSVTVTASNLDIRDLTHAQDSLLMYGFDGTDNVRIRTDADGYLQIRSISDSVTVTASDLDIRDLSHAQDSLLIYGFDGSANQRIRTDSEGYLQMENIPAFTETNNIDVPTDNDYSTLSYVDTSTQTVYTFYVYNKGPNSATVRLDVSPDQTTYYNDVLERTIASGATDVFVAKTFLRYTRIAYKSAVSGSSTTLDVFFQKQAM